VLAALLLLTATSSVVVAGTPVPQAELEARAQAFAHNQALSVRSAAPVVARQALDERWALHDARELHLVPSDAQVDAAITAAGTPDFLTRWTGLTGEPLRTRVRSELAERALADRALARTHSASAYGRYFLERARRRHQRTRCTAPFDPADRCPHGHGDRGESALLLGVGDLRGRDLVLDLAPLLGIESGDPQGKGYRAAEKRLRAAMPKALARRVTVFYDALDVYVSGPRPDLIAAARVAHRLALGHATPVLTGLRRGWAVT
jgi:hypothetical protein